MACRAIIVLALLMTVSCAARIDCPERILSGNGPSMQTFSYEPKELKPKVVSTKVEDELVIQKLEFTVADMDGLPKRFKAYLLTSRFAREPRPAVILLPPTEGTYDLLIDFGRFFVERGYVAFIIERRSSFFKPERSDITYDKRLMIQTVIDVRRSIDWLQSQEFVEPRRIAILGVSLGAIIAELATAADHRIGASAFLLGSSELDEVLLKSGYSRIVQYRRTLLEKLPGTKTEKMQAIKRELADIEPANYARYIDPKRVIFICARFDAIIPYSISRRTICNLNSPRSYAVPTGHYSTFLFKNWALKRVFRHFEETFALPQDF
ncbi:MAG TPA: hypothetical protein ENF73_06005 [Proteobacteria bacterium]|nr:hypothetical protein [Pseudomonadota bacterium]